jgi:hypothetical protein
MRDRPSDKWRPGHAGSCFTHAQRRSSVDWPRWRPAVADESSTEDVSAPNGTSNARTVRRRKCDVYRRHSVTQICSRAAQRHGKPLQNQLASVKNWAFFHQMIHHTKQLLINDS